MAETELFNVVATEPELVLALRCKSFDHAATQQLRAQVGKTLPAHQGKDVVLDLAEVDFLASITLGALVEFANVQRQQQRKLVLASVQPAILKMMTASAIAGLFEIREGHA